MVGKHGGDLGAVDIVAPDAKLMTRDITVRARDGAHQEQIVSSLHRAAPESRPTCSPVLARRSTMPRLHWSSPNTYITATGATGCRTHEIPLAAQHHDAAAAHTSLGW
jgi:hypothetical protein